MQRNWISLELSPYWQVEHLYHSVWHHIFDTCMDKMTIYISVAVRCLYSMYSVNGEMILLVTDFRIHLLVSPASIFCNSLRPQAAAGSLHQALSTVSRQGSVASHNPPQHPLHEGLV